VLAYVADQLRVNPMSIVQYAQDREATRFEHLAELQRVYEFRSFSAQAYREMATWLLSLVVNDPRSESVWPTNMKHCPES
jgi:hypothetical protein